MFVLVPIKFQFNFNSDNNLSIPDNYNFYLNFIHVENILYTYITLDTCKSTLIFEPFYGFINPPAISTHKTKNNYYVSEDFGFYENKDELITLFKEYISLTYGNSNEV